METTNGNANVNVSILETTAPKLKPQSLGKKAQSSKRKLFLKDVLPTSFGLMLLWGLIPFFCYAAFGDARGLTEDNLTRLNHMLLITSVFSLLASGYIISTAFHKGKSHPIGLKLVVSMAVADFLFALKFIVSAARFLDGYFDIVTTGTGLCYWSGIMGQFFGLGTISWNFMISVNLFLALRNPNRHKTMSLKHYFIGCHIYVWGLSALTCIIGVSTYNFTFTSDGTCWLQHSFVFEFYAPLYLYFSFSLFVIGYAFYQLSKAPRKISVKRITALTAAFIAVWLWGVIFRIIEYVHGENYNFPTWLTFTQAFFLGIGGFVNFCVWVVAPWLEKMHRKLNPQEYEPTKFGANPETKIQAQSSNTSDESNTNTNTNTNTTGSKTREA